MAGSLVPCCWPGRLGQASRKQVPQLLLEAAGWCLLSKNPDGLSAHPSRCSACWHSARGKRGAEMRAMKLAEKEGEGFTAGLCLPSIANTPTSSSCPQYLLSILSATPTPAS